MSNAANDPTATEGAQPSRLKRILPIVLAGSIGLTVGGGAGVLVAGPVMAERAVARAEVVAEEVVAKVAAEHIGGGAAKGGHGAGKEAEHGAVVGAPVYKVENLVLNPAQSGGTRFLVASLALEVADSATSTAMKERDSEVRDAVLRVLGAKTVGQLSDMTGRSVLKQELQTAVDSIFGEHSVSAVYFPQFVIQ
jgi:flagellar FliL protein